jgi:predicted TPR repeat methyltransferase
VLQAGTLVDDIEARAARRSHARDLYDFYSVGYDDHMRKKLLYTAPRLLRAAVRSAVNATFTALPAARRAEHGGDVLRYMNASLSILDLGCGTGLCGSWMESYASEFVGVDIRYTQLECY